MMIASEEIDVQISCPFHNLVMDYFDFDADKNNHILTFKAKCGLCLNNVIVKVKL